MMLPDEVANATLLDEVAWMILLDEVAYKQLTYTAAMMLPFNHLC